MSGIERCTGTITVVGASNVPSADLNGKSDPYCKLKDVTGLIGEDRKTKTKKKTLNPTWNHTFDVVFNYKLRKFKFEIWDKDFIGKDEKIGKCKIYIHEVWDGQLHDLHIPLNTRGTLNVRIQINWLIPLAFPGQWIPLTDPLFKVGLGWDAPKGEVLDLDSSIICYDSNPEPTIVFFQNLRAYDGAIRHAGDNTTGEGKGDDETIHFDLSILPAHVMKMSLVINSFSMAPFSKVKSAYCRIATDQHTMAFYRLTKSTNKIALFLGEFIKDMDTGMWYYQTIGHACNGRTAKDSLADVNGFKGSIVGPN
eukprot:TRINITY_DN4368_c0_g1_i1.p1 TRINITY_DN4368_c0_g1~~TRINITY_DN4368_c0_g1_i1.p1  ORF type:complete len:309 (-),score=55.01 TRINITY_DN4368_c0_g1_i1:43-969(-)